MDQTFTCALLLLSLSAAFGKYVYIEQRMTWHEAQSYCRMFYTDLATVSNKHDIRQLWRLAGDSRDFFWIGMKRSSTDNKKWMWSGGGEVSTFFWAPSQPDNRPHEDYGVIRHYMWHDSQAFYRLPFFCYSVVVVRVRKTWEEALQYCREHHHDLASAVSEAEMLLIQKELEKTVTAEHVWIGLRFLPGRWVWVDGRPLHYEAWGQENKPACPDVSLKCAALQVRAGTQSNSTVLPLFTHASDTVGTGPDHTDDTASVVDTPANTGLDISGVSQAAAGVNRHVWEAHNCEERLHFICY
ncbi:macrophage mannose receptor 1-like [Trachinotus anak]|uniref:macrophage mannose receptor 1-like n=1 Tax=Trachinotus anak TaxID=443729 RepID=UPI0039F1EB8F